jgi:hypothetical protein
LKKEHFKRLLRSAFFEGEFLVRALVEKDWCERIIVGSG